MAIDPSASVEAIEGIGPAIATRLEAIRVHAVYDLLRATSGQLHEAVKDIASLPQVRGWRQAAALLQVAEVTPQWAEALVKGSIFTITDLRHARLDQLDAIFVKAKDEGVISAVPSANQIVEMLKDAVQLDRSGAITGTVRDQANRPVAGATARVGAIHQVTDERGRFRLLRIPLRGTATLRIEHRDFKPYEQIFERILGLAAIGVDVIRLTARPVGTSPEPAAAALSELAGDTLPAMSGHSVTSHEVDASELEEGDILSLMSFYDDGVDAKLVSKLLTFADGKFVVRWIRTPRTNLPATARRGDHFRVRPEKLEPIRIDGRKLRAYTKLRSLQRTHANDPRPVTPMEFEAVFQSRLAEVRSLGLLKKS